jgi:hypothetical protein
LVGGGSGWGTILPTLALFAAAPLLAAVATSGLSYARDWAWGAAMLLGWLLLALFVAPHVREIHDPGTVSVSGLPRGLVFVAAGLALLAVVAGLAATRSRGDQRLPNS